MSSAPTEIQASSRVLSTDMRAKLMRVVYDELDKLPATLEKMEPKARLDYLIKLLPYAAPKMDVLDPTHGEPINWAALGIGGEFKRDKE